MELVSWILVGVSVAAAVFAAGVVIGWFAAVSHAEHVEADWKERQYGRPDAD